MSTTEQDRDAEIYKLKVKLSKLEIELMHHTGCSAQDVQEWHAKEVDHVPNLFLAQMLARCEAEVARLTALLPARDPQ